MPDLTMQQRVRVLSNGISKQSDTVRYPNQVEAAENVQFSILKGASKRAGSSTHVRLQDGGASTGAVYKLHMIERDDVERYCIIYGEGGYMQIVDLSLKRSCSVTMKGSSSSYLTTGNPEAADLRFLTVGDTTFVLNTKVATGKIDNNTIDYRVMPHRIYRDSYDSVTGVATFKITPVPWSERNYYEQRIKKNESVTGGNWRLRFRGETTKVFKHESGTGFSGAGTNYHIPWDAEASHYVSGNEGDGIDQYLERLKTIGSGKTICTYGNLPKQDILVEFSRDIDINDGGTELNSDESAPKLAKDVGGDDLLDFISYSLSGGSYSIARGSDDRNPVPEPITNNEVIKDMAFYRGRLVLAFPNTLLFSRTNATYDFFIQKPASIADTDPIEISIASDDVANIDFIVPFRGSLMILTRQGRQYFLEDVTTLSPSTATVVPTTKYETQLVKPKTLGEAIYMVGSSATFSPIYQYFYDDLGKSSRAIDVSKHVQGLIPTDVGGFTGSPASQMVVAVSKVEPLSNTARNIESDSSGDWGDESVWTFTDTSTALVEGDLGPQPYDVVDIKSGHTIDMDPSFSGTDSNGYEIPPATTAPTAELFAYRWYDEGNERVQSAWTKWTYGEENLLDAAVLDDEMYVLRRQDATLTGNTEVYIDKIYLGDETPTTSKYGFNVKLDYQIHGLATATTDQPTTSAYDAANDKTTYTLKTPTDVDGAAETFKNHNIDTLVLSDDFVIVDTDHASYNPAVAITHTSQPTKNAAGTALNIVNVGDGTVYVRADEQSAELKSVRLAGDDSDTDLAFDLRGGDVILGSKYTASVTLTKAMLRDQQNNPVREGRLIVNEIVVDHMDSGAYDLVITPTNTSQETRTMSTSHTGEETGTFNKIVTCNADTNSFKLQSTGVQPVSWTSYEWHGRYSTYKG